MQFENFTIRHPLQNDAKDFFELIESNRKRLESFFAGTVSRTKTLLDTEIYTAEIITKIDKRIYFPFLVIDNNNQKIAAFVDVKNIDWNIPKAELGCFADSHYEGKGVASKAMKMVIQVLFEEMGFNKLFLRTHQSNKAAISLAEKSGFEVEGILRSDYKTTNGELVDLIYYGLLKK